VFSTRQPPNFKVFTILFYSLVVSTLSLLLKLVFAAHFPLLYPGDIIAIYYRDREVIGGIPPRYSLPHIHVFVTD